MSRKRVLTAFLSFALILTLIPAQIAYSLSPPEPDIPFASATLTKGETKTWDVPISNPAVKDMMDILYVIDTTGSMEEIRDTIANTVNQFTDDLVAAGATDIWFGAAYFGDSYIDYPWFDIELPLGAHDLDDVKAAISALTTTGGGDAPEDALYAYIMAIKSTDALWREDAQRVVVVITDDATKLRPDVEVDGYPVTVEGAVAITNDYGIDAVFVSFDTNFLDFIGSTYDGTTAITMKSFANGLGITEYRWLTEAELQTALSTAVIPPVTEIPTYECEARVESITYNSDNAVSNDVTVTIAAPSSFLLAGGETKEFNLTAVATSDPARTNETTTVEIGFYVDGVKVGSQTLTFYVEATQGFILPATGDSASVIGWMIVIAELVLFGCLFMLWRKRQQLH